jgi:hypothetical protein
MWLVEEPTQGFARTRALYGSIPHLKLDTDSVER